ncbi:MAG: hypothetical protein C5B54_10175 [Acidobacteria bacterium]|nr:MAG: hypothetical protein C5B54_10175 [Acidobacteriota bacterium]
MIERRRDPDRRREWRLILEQSERQRVKIERLLADLDRELAQMEGASADSLSAHADRLRAMVHWFRYS